MALRLRFMAFIRLVYKFCTQKIRNSILFVYVHQRFDYNHKQNEEQIGGSEMEITKREFFERCEKWRQHLAALGKVEYCGPWSEAKYEEKIALDCSCQ